MPTATRHRMVETASRLFQRDGYDGTSWRGLVEEAGTPWGSVHHHFPGGKEELGVAAIEFGGESVVALITHCFDSQPTDPASAVREAFRLSALGMEATGYEAACPVASVALATVPGSEPMAAAARNAFITWEKLIARRLRDAGIKKKRARSLSRMILTMFEGALIRSRIGGSTQPLIEAGEHMYEVLNEL